MLSCSGFNAFNSYDVSNIVQPSGITSILSILSEGICTILLLYSIRQPFTVFHAISLNNILLFFKTIFVISFSSSSILCEIVFLNVNTIFVKCKCFFEKMKINTYNARIPSIIYLDEIKHNNKVDKSNAVFLKRINFIASLPKKKPAIG